MSTRELDVLECAADGLSTEQSAAKLGVTLQTIKFHRANLMTKLGATSIAHAVGIGFGTGLLGVPDHDAPADAGGLSEVAERLEDVATALSQLAANVRRIADVSAETDDRNAGPVEEPHRDSGADDDGSQRAPGKPRSAPRSVYARDR